MLCQQSYHCRGVNVRIVDFSETIDQSKIWAKDSYPSYFKTISSGILNIFSFELG